MGRNNRQRRAAKQKIRMRRGPTPPRSSERADEFAELFDHPGLYDGFDPEPPRAAPTAPRRESSTVTERAQRLLDQWIAVALRQGDDGVLRRWAEHQLWSVDEAVLDRADELLGSRMLADAAHLWSAGWQPRDLLHVALRIDKRAATLAADLTIEQLRRSGRSGLAPEGWRDQLESTAQRVREAGLPAVGDGSWRPLGRLLMTGVGGSETLSSALRLLVRIERLPSITMTLPPPSTWRAAVPRPAATLDQVTSGERREKVLTRIRALLAKAESTEHAAEAETFTAKAQDLMTRHAIDEALLHAGVEDSVDVRSRRVLIDNPYPYEKVQLLNQVAAANRVRVIWLEDLAMATAVGTPVDVDQVEMLFVSLLIQATRAMAEAGAARPGSFDRSPRFRRSFLTSYALRIGERLVTADAEATASYGSELVPVLKRQQEAVDEEVARLFPNIYQSPNRRYYDRRGWDAGREAADRATFVAGRIAG
jgi:hypothetical protein